MTTILDTLKNTADEEKAATALAAFARENPEALETIIKANQLFLEKFAPSGGENLYNAYRETARAYKKKNLIQSNYPYDSQNYAEAAAYYLKAAEAAPDAGRKLSSLDGAVYGHCPGDGRQKTAERTVCQGFGLCGTDVRR